MTPEQQQAVSDAFAAISLFDLSAFPAIFTENAVVASPAGVFHGHDGARKLITELARQYTAWAPAARRTIADGNAAAVEFAADVTDFGGGQHRADGCAVFEFRGPLVAGLRVYWRPEDMNS